MRHHAYWLMPLLVACNSNVTIDLSGLEPLRAVASARLAPLARGTIEVGGGTRPYKFAFAAEVPVSGKSASLDSSSGDFRLGPTGEVTEVIRVRDAKGEEQLVSIEVTAALAVDPTRAVVEPQGFVDFDAVGGEPPYTFRIEGLAADRLDAETGVFQAGPSGGRRVDLVVTDVNGAEARAETRVAMTFTTGNNPFDVAGLDFDRDGALDLVVANNNSANLALMKGDGRGQFTRVGLLRLLTFPRALKALDLDRDELVDLVVVTASPEELIVLLQDPRAVGGFREVLRTPLGRDPVDVEVLPLDAGTYSVASVGNTGAGIDLVTLAASPGQVRVSSTARIPLGDRGTKTALADVVGDGNVDLVVALTTAAPNKSKVLYFTGDGRGGFGSAPVTELELGEGAVALDVGRLGGGAKDDVAAVSFTSNELALVVDDATTGRPTLVRRPIAPGAGGQCAPCGRAADAACTGAAACVQARAGAETKVCAATCRSSLDCPNGTDCQPVGTLGSHCLPAQAACPATSLIPTATGPRAVRVVDLDADGVAEVAVSVTSPAGVQVFKADDKGTYVAAYVAATGARPSETAAVDVNADGFPDLVVANILGQSISVLPGLGRLFTKDRDYTVGAASAGVRIAQLDRDARGTNDLVVKVGDSFLTLLGDGRGGHVPYRRIPFSGASNPYLADMNGDGALDLLAFHGIERRLEVALWQEDVGYKGGPSTLVGNGPSALALGDVDGDGALDAVVANNTDRHFSVHRGLGAGRFNGFTEDAVVHRYQSPTVLAREVLTSEMGGKVHHFLTVGAGGGNTYFDAVALSGAGGSPTVKWSTTVNAATGLSAVPLDCDANGIPDFALAYVLVPQNAFDGQVWKGSSDGKYALASELHTGVPVPGQPGSYSSTGAAALVAADFTGDGKTDVVISTRLLRQLVLFRGKGDCTFELAGRVATDEALSFGMAAGDLDGDGLPDLASPVPPDRLTLYRNLGARSGEVQHFPPAGALCSECTTDSDCGTPTDLCVDAIGKRRLCGRDCSGGRACPAGFRCMPFGNAQQCVHQGDECVR